MSALSSNADVEAEDVVVLSGDVEDELVDTGTDELTGLDRFTAKQWIYPVNYPVRDYQKNIVARALFTNTLVTLPTGLGKTFIAAVVMYNYHRWFPGHKIVFMAHSRPLVSQQIEACAQIMGMCTSVFAHLNGSISVSSRKAHWDDKRLFFLTPQVFNNDLTRGLVSPESIRCVVIDEAHKALGNQAFCQAIRSLRPFNTMFRVLALSATPGDDIAAVKKVVENLMISHLELRTEEDEDIKKYLHTKKIDNIVVTLDSKIVDYKSRMLRVAEKYLKQLNAARAIPPSYGSLSSFSLVLKQKQFIGNPTVGSDQRGLVLSNFSVVISLYKAIEELIVHGLRSLHNKLLAMKSGDGSKSNTHHRLAKDADFLAVINALEEYIGQDKDIAFDPDVSMARLQDALDAQAGDARPPLVYSHPKFVVLEEIVTQHFGEWKDKGESTRVIIFCKARSCTGEICNFLNRFRPLVKPMVLIGQSQSKSGSESTSRGLKQSAQLEVMRKFRDGAYNTLVATCVGEEGLDVGEVDLIVNFDASRNSNTQVQRSGRTGRKRDGRVINLLTEGKEEQDYNMSVSKSANINKRLSTGIKNLPLAPSCRLIPDDVQPRCQEMCLTQAKKPLQCRKIDTPIKEIVTKKDQNKSRKRGKKDVANKGILSQASQSKYDIRYAMNKAKEKREFPLTQGDGTDFLSVGAVDYFKKNKKSPKSDVVKDVEIICLDENLPEISSTICYDKKKLLYEIMNGTDDNIDALKVLDSFSLDDLLELVSSNIDMIRMPDRFANCKISLPKRESKLQDLSDLEDVPLPSPPPSQSEMPDDWENNDLKMDNNIGDDIAEKNISNNAGTHHALSVVNGQQSNASGSGANINPIDVSTATTAHKPKVTASSVNHTSLLTSNIDIEKSSQGLEPITNRETGSKHTEIVLSRTKSESLKDKLAVNLKPKNPIISVGSTNEQTNKHFPCLSVSDVPRITTNEDKSISNQIDISDIPQSVSKAPTVNYCSATKTTLPVKSDRPGNEMLTITQALDIVAEFNNKNGKQKNCNSIIDQTDNSCQVRHDHALSNSALAEPSKVPSLPQLWAGINEVDIDEHISEFDNDFLPLSQRHINKDDRNSINATESSSHNNKNTLMENSIIKSPLINIHNWMEDRSPSMISSGISSSKSSKVKKSLQFGEPELNNRCVVQSPTQANFRLLDIDSDDDLFAEAEVQREIQMTQAKNQEREISGNSQANLENKDIIHSSQKSSLATCSMISPLPTAIFNIENEWSNDGFELAQNNSLTSAKSSNRRISTGKSPNEEEKSPMQKMIHSEEKRASVDIPRKAVKTAIVRPLGMEDIHTGWISAAKKPAPSSCLPIPPLFHKKSLISQTRTMDSYLERPKSPSLSSVKKRVAPLNYTPSRSFSSFDIIPDDFDLSFNVSPKNTTPNRSNFSLAQHSTPLACSKSNSSRIGSLKQSTPLSSTMKENGDFSVGAMEAIRAVEEAVLADKKVPILTVSSDSELSEGALEAIRAVEQFELNMSQQLQNKSEPKKVAHMSSSLCEVSRTSHANVSARSEDAVFRLWSSDEDDREVFQQSVMPSIKRGKNRKTRKKRTEQKCRRRANPFVEDEAELSGSSGSSDEENTSGLDEMDSSFLDERLAPTQAPDVDMTARYLSTVKSPRIMPGAFKIPNAPRRMDIDVFSQVVQQDEDYVEDSFCVRDVTEVADESLSALEIAEMALEQKRKRRRKKSPVVEQTGRKRKRKRIVVLDSSSDEDIQPPFTSRKTMPSITQANTAKPAPFPNRLPDHGAPGPPLDAVVVTGNRASVQTSSGQQLILIGSRIIASAPDITIALRAKFQFKVDVRSCPGADFIVGWKLGINRVTLSDFCNGSPATKASFRESLQTLTELFLKPVLIIEDDKNKSAPKTAGCHNSMWTKHSAKRLARINLAGIVQLFAKDKEETAEIIAQLAKAEYEKGCGLVTDFKEFTPQLEARLKFYTRLPGVNIGMALKMCRKFSTVKSMVAVCDSVAAICAHFGVPQRIAAMILHALFSPA